MRATGIVRRIDELGRVVIPKEIRRTLRIREGDPLEIYTDHDGEVVLKKYSPIGELAGFASQYAETLQKTCSMAVVICDRDVVISAAGVSKKEYMIFFYRLQMLSCRIIFVQCIFSPTLILRKSIRSNTLLL